MLFHEAIFIFIFFPVVLFGLYLSSKFGSLRSSIIWLVISSLIFYGSWDFRLAFLLIFSVVMNFVFAGLIEGGRNSDRSRSASWWLRLGIVANLGLLGYFKYANFFIDNFSIIAGSEISHINLLYPVGLSFYTFIQIGYLIDLKNGQAKRESFTRFMLFASFFPYLTAGPIVLQREIFPQYEADRLRFDLDRLIIGLALFSIGLFKKLVLADGIAPFADSAFAAAYHGDIDLHIVDAWFGATAYMLQLYFDFSGYSDMAIALGYIIGIQLPYNFNSPLKATSIIDFWRRWHMTMTRFFTNYVYTPVALSMTRKSLAGTYGQRHRFLVATAYPTILTFTVAGLWHGAGWTFVVFGIIHGVALAANHAWRQAEAPAIPVVLGWVLTMLVFLVSLVFFRSPSLGVATTMLEGMIGLGGGIAFAAVAADSWFWIAILGAVALAAPNSQELLHRFDISCDRSPSGLGRWPDWIAWRPTPSWTAFSAILLVIAIVTGAGGSPFIYYQF